MRTIFHPVISAATRRSIGTGVLGGMLAATFLAIFFVPLFFVLIGKMNQWVTGRKAAEPPAVPPDNYSGR